MARIYLIRHGKPAAAWGLDGDADPGLDETGQAQAQAACDILLGLPAGQRPARVVSSPQRRCRETAAPLALALGVDMEIDPVFGEIETPPGLAAAERGPWLKRSAQGRWREVEGDRDYDAWRAEIMCSLASRGGSAVFSHYIAINAAHSLLTGDDRVVGFHPDHASITVLEVRDGQVSLVQRGREAETAIL